ncbi:GDSL-type esterase/lipase family protein [Wohlfahrtiimonas larvae]|uniref:Arylesterase n=1 Tax=Wohlfahrtiimonas larvae TaxID=1157986 RepID=A0ABP9MPV8_9GAMM|nr:GDSL-type esterase/lipase family protein [Wohlfahrtiimonas larvae]
MKYLWVLLLSFVVMACGDKPQKYDRLSSGATVLAFGDSVTFGYGVAPQDSYPTVLANLSRWNVINAGINGERADQAKLRIDNALAEHNPKLVIIELGGNDFLQRRNANAVKEDLRAIIQSVKAHGSIPVLVAVPSLSAMAALTGKPSDADLYKELAKEEKINLISNIFSDILGQENLKNDQIHPNQAGYKMLAEGIYQALNQMGL